MKLNSIEALAFEYQLLERGYKKYTQSFNGSDFVYWKSFEKHTNEFDDEIPGYQIGISFYDFSKFQGFENEKSMHIECHFLLGENSKIQRLNLSISDSEITIDKFESFCGDFYNGWLKKKLLFAGEYSL